MREWGLYVHIPFCRKKCFYCDFSSYAGCENRMEDYTEALCQEMMTQGTLLRAAQPGPPATVYFGGGTPTALPASCLARIIEAVRSNFGWQEDCEFTIEANPGTVSAELFCLLRQKGVNRISLGVQSFNDVLLKKIGRIHRAGEAEEAVMLAKKAGFSNISLDLMYGLPGQDLTDWQASLKKAASLSVQHISIYGLQVEENTVFGRWQAEGKLLLPAEEEAEAMYDYAVEKLPELGFRRYEIANFAQEGKESRHNQSYWHDIPYLGVGAAAHSYWQGKRYYNVSGVNEYISLQQEGGKFRFLEEEPTEKYSMEEFAFLALRTVRGIDKKTFQQKFGVTLEAVYAEVIQRMKGKGLMAENQEAVYLTPLGMKYGNQVFAEFLL